MSGLIPRTQICSNCIRRMRVSSSPSHLSRLSISNAAGPSRGARVVYPSHRSMRSFSSTSQHKAQRTVIDMSEGKQIDMRDFPPERIRNLSIIAHIDHGKSTLADRLLQMTGTVPASSNPQFLDKLKVERERGITVKAQTVSIIHEHTDGNRYLINLIDTPGHVDFSYEVSRSIGACEGGLILVDCTQGIQAQTLSVFYVALEADLKLLAVVNKVDLPHASPEETSDQIEGTLGLDSNEHMYISAKSGLGVDEVLKQIVEGLPSPRKWKQDDGKLRALVFDTHYDHYRGVVALVRLYSGQIKVGDKVRFLQADRRYEVLEIGINNPEETPVDVLLEGQVGMKNSEEAHIGDTVCIDREVVEPLPGFKPMKAMVYAGVFPVDTGEFDRLEEAIGRLTLNDRSVTVAKDSSTALGQGFRLGFLGTLHMDVFRQRLEDEYSSEVIITAPTVPYKVNLVNGKTEFISNPTEFPDLNDGKMRASSVEEPMVNATIIVPNEYIGQMMALCSNYRGVQMEYKVMETSGRSMLKYLFPLSEIVTDFFSALKSASSGFASFDYEDAGYMQSDMVKMNILLNGKPVDALSMIVHRAAAQKIGKEWVRKLKDVVPRQMFELAIQAAIGSKVLARESLPAMRKDVTAGLYGGHYERKLKHLTKQKEGKKRLKMLAGNIEVPQSAFFQVLSSRPRNFSTSARSQTHTTPLPAHHYEPPLPIIDTGKDRPYRFNPLGRRLNALLSDPIAPTVNDASMPLLKPLTLTKREHEPLRPPAIAPVERSKHISALLREAQRPADDQRFLNVYAPYVRSYYASPTGDLLTPQEIRSSLISLFNIQRDKRRGLKPADVEQRIRELADHLQHVSGKESEEFINEILSKVEIHSLANMSEGQLNDMESRIKSLSQSGLPLNTTEIEFFFHALAISSHDNGRFERYWGEFVVQGGLKMTGFLYVARLKYFDRTRRHDLITPLIQDAISRLPGEEVVPMLNNAMVMFADEGAWDMAAEIYTGLTGSTAPFPLDNPSNELTFPTGIRSDLRTFTDLIPLLSFSGHLHTALFVLTDMSRAENVASVREYMAIVDGFASFGVSGHQAEDIRHIPTNLFPPFENVPVGRTRRSHRAQKQEQAREKSTPYAQIWESGARNWGMGTSQMRDVLGVFSDGNVSNLQSSIPPSPEKAAWNRQTLDLLFQTCMAVQPGVRGVPSPRIAPTPDMAWYTLMAFARVSSGDMGLVQRVWETMDDKFSGRTGEKWFEWRMNARLEKVVRVLTLPPVEI